MNIKELAEFAVICDKGSFAKASKELYMSPQGLSRVVKNLESELECTLFKRTAGGIELTKSGAKLRDFAKETLKSYEELRSEIEKIEQSETGTIKLLSAYDIIRYFTPACVLDFMRMYPNIHFSFEEYPDRIVERMLMEQKGNVALSIGPFSQQCFRVKTLKRLPLGLLVYAGHPLAKRDEVTIEDLKGELLYLENSSFKLNELVKSQCWEYGFEPNIVFETNGFELCYKMCREKKGLSVVVDFIHEDMQTEDLILIPFKEKQMAWEIGLLTEKDEEMGTAVERFYSFMESFATKR